MDQRLTLVTLGVRNLAASRTFYSGGLGWTPTLDLEEIVFYQVGPGLLLGLFPLDDLAADTGHQATWGTPFTLSHNVDARSDVDAAVDLARRAGATVLKEPQVADFGGYHAYFADPDGHRWEVCHNPGLTVDGDGVVHFGPVPEPG
jgi:catechol 2,3-dioxygenase-like lactoylglutathione lyase family enzyme